jgi:hypothetical protein
MKNIVEILPKTKCESCNSIGAFCYTPCGADWITCPICDGRNDLVDDTQFPLYYDSDNKYLNNSYCSNCKIMFDVGCTHAVNGCTDDCYNGHLIKKWKNIKENIIYDGMPQFDSDEEWYNNAFNIEIISWYCVNNSEHCNRGYYPKSKYPNYYKLCKLCK